MDTPHVITDHRWIIVAKVGASYGLKGFCRLNSFVEDVVSLLKQDVFMKRRGIFMPCAPFELAHQGSRVMIRFEECTTPEATVPYVNLELAVLSTALPPCAADEFYWAELEGMQVITSQQVSLGTVAYLFESGASDIVVVRGKKEYLIPFVDHYILSIDRVQRVIVVDWDPDF